MANIIGMVINGIKKSQDMLAVDRDKSMLKYIASGRAGVKGLQNLGSTCFMSVILQSSILHNPILRNFFLSDGHNPNLCMELRIRELNGALDSCIACDVALLFQQFYSDENNAVAPAELLETIWRVQQDLAGYRQQDAHELLVCLLNQLHLALSSTAVTQNGTLSISSHSSISGDDRNCECIVHRAFGGLFSSDLICSNCHSMSTSYDHFLNIPLDIQMENPNEPAGLIACLEKFTARENLDRQLNCQNCGGYQESFKQMSIRSLPPVICFQFKVRLLTPYNDVYTGH